MPLESSMRDKLISLGAATLHEAQGQSGALDAALRPIAPHLKLAGTAYTVAARPDDNLMLHYALSKAKPGDVLVVDAKGFVEGGAWGDVTTLAAQVAGIAGLVIDGAVRDVEAIIAMGFPVFCRGVSIKGTAKAQKGRANEPIHCAGATVNPGDIVVGDADGVVVVAADRLEKVIAAATAREEKEEELRRQIRAGHTTVELLGLAPVLREMGLE
jgi:4-hydroxy-4-methyl-2-oxoglutarate aldolase